MPRSKGSEREATPDLDVVLRWPSDDARAWAEASFARLCANRDVLAVVLFGSTVRPTDESFDFDCLYIYRGEPPDLPPAPMEVDIRAYRADQVEQLIEDGHDLLGWSLRLGKLVCERGRYWTRLKASWEWRLPFPPPEVAEARAIEAERLLAEFREIGDEDAAVEQLVTAATHRAREALLRSRVFPASRPELPEQLRRIGAGTLADALEAAIALRRAVTRQTVGGDSRRNGDGLPS